MPFKRTSDWKYSWEEEAEKGNEFIKPITAETIHNHWTLALDAVSGLEKKINIENRSAVKKPGQGILVIHYHGKPTGVLGSPNLFQDILLAWRGAGSTVPHPAIRDALALLADSTKPAPPQPLNTSTLGVRHHPSDIGRFLREQARQGGIVVVLYFQTTYAFLIPLPILARFRREAKDATSWADGVLSWLCLPDHTPVKNKMEWL